MNINNSIVRYLIDNLPDFNKRFIYKILDINSHLFDLFPMKGKRNSISDFHKISYASPFYWPKYIMSQNEPFLAFSIIVEWFPLDLKFLIDYDKKNSIY